MVRKARIESLINRLNQDLFEKEKAIRLTLLTALGGESIFLLGPPGVAKSMIARRLKYAFANAKSFEYLMGKFSTPDEVFGPVSISKLKNEDKYERLTDKYLPGANIVFLDEIWKASPPIQNALLTVLNEKIYRNGEQEFKVDLRGLISASNELPLKGEGLEALWDRFLVRLIVGNIDKEALFEKLIALSGDANYEDIVDEELKITGQEYEEWQKSIGKVKIPPHILGLINYLRVKIKKRNIKAGPEEQMYVSDRRWKKIAHLLRTSAFFNDRDEVDMMDSFLIADCIWDQDNQISEAKEMTYSAIQSQGYNRLVNLSPIRNELESILEEVVKETQIIEKETVRQMKVYRDNMENDYVRIKNFWGENSDAFARVEDLEKVNPEKIAYVPIFELAGKIFRPFQTYGVMRKEEFVLFNNQRELGIETEEVEKEKIIPKKPSIEMVRVWNSQIQILIESCEQFLAKVEKQKDKDQQYLHNNLFVEKELAAYAKAGMESTSNDIVALKLEIQKAQHSYESIKES